MKKYHIMVQVDKAHGHQCWEVEARSREEALQKYNEGNGEIIHEELEVTALCEPEIDAVHEA